MRILVTGGAGFVGSNVVDALVAEGDEVVALDDLSTGAEANLAASGARLIVADIADRAALAGALAGERFDAVAHLASKTKVVESMADPELYRRVIVDGTRNVVDAARAAGVRRLVNVSSGGVIYGETPGRCADEDQPVRPVSPYGVCKAEAERLVAGSGLSACTLRPANIYGPRQRRDLEGGVVAIFAARWAAGEPLTVYGDGTMERDYVHVGDIAEAVIAALRGTVTGVYNVGTGVATSVNTLIALMSDVLGAPAGIDRAEERPGELRRSCLDAGRAARDGLWTPRTPLADGLRRTLA